MNLRIWTALILLTAPAWSATARRTVDVSRVTQPQKRSAQFGAVRTRSAASAPKAAALVQAPGVIQTNLFDSASVVWFVTTELLPKGTILAPFVAFPDGTEMPLDALTMTEDVQAGSSFDMPNIRKFGPFWPQGLLTYGMVVTTNGRDTQTTADFPVASARNYDDVTQMVPRIASTAETLNDRDVTLSIRGVFTADAPYVLLEDVVVPRSAIRVSSSEITVNLSRVPGLDLSAMSEFLLTVGQSGWSDTAIFRHMPLRPGAYNPAPQ